MSWADQIHSGQISESAMVRRGGKALLAIPGFHEAALSAAHERGTCLWRYLQYQSLLFQSVLAPANLDVPIPNPNVPFPKAIIDQLRQEEPA